MKVTQGVAILVRAGLDIGISPVQYDFTDAIKHRALVVKLELQGIVPHVFGCIYGKSGESLGAVNLELLALVAQIQHCTSMPVLFAGDRNFSPQATGHTDFQEVRLPGASPTSANV